MLAGIRSLVFIPGEPNLAVFFRQLSRSGTPKGLKRSGGGRGLGWGGAGGTCRRPARYLWCADNSRRLSPRVRVHHATSARRSWRRCARMYVRRCGRRGCVRVKVNGGVYVGHEAAGARGSPVVNGIKLFNHKFFPLLGGNILSAIFSLSLSLFLGLLVFPHFAYARFLRPPLFRENDGEACEAEARGGESSRLSRSAVSLIKFLIRDDRETRKQCTA